MKRFLCPARAVAVSILEIWTCDVKSRLWQSLAYVFLVLATLSGVLFSSVRQRRNNLAVQKAFSQLRALASLAEVYHDVFGEYPESKDAFFVLHPRIHRPFSRPEFWVDPWGHDYVYMDRSSGFRIISHGQDGLLDSSDDLVVDKASQSGRAAEGSSEGR